MYYKVGWNERKGKQRGRFWLQGIREDSFHTQNEEEKAKKKKKKTLSYQEDKKGESRPPVVVVVVVYTIIYGNCP